MDGATGPAADDERLAVPAAPATPPRRLPPARMVIAVAAGGAVGASIRAAALSAFPTAADGFPWATFTQNVTGALLLGALVTAVLARQGTSRYAGPLLGAGLLGAYTTVSSFAVELGLLLHAGRWAVAGSYAAATMLAGLGAAWAGMVAGRRHRDRGTRA